jgi:hypothetical protein
MAEDSPTDICLNINSSPINPQDVHKVSVLSLIPFSWPSNVTYIHLV